MKTHLFVISDLHLGGAPAANGKPAFQMCTANGRVQLARFIAWAGRQRRVDWDVHLVIAGDIVDFLAEERAGGFRAFTNDDHLAAKKLAAILADSDEVWQALRGFVADGSALTLMLGNHDLELSLPAPRRFLLETLGPGRIEFIYDNQAFTLGKVLVEHGNRYDDWNAVPHDDLREARSRLSRGERAEFDPLPGSRLVVDLVNPTKENLAFIDLLKPEDAALMPFLALLAPNRYHQVAITLKNRVRALRVRYGSGQQPKDRNFVGYEVVGGGATPAPAAALSTGDAGDDALLALADQAAAGGDASMVSAAGSFLDRWRAKLADGYRRQQLELLLKVLRAFRGSNDRAFNIETEEKKYLAAAIETAARGYSVVVYGHTHLPKRVSLAGRKASDGTEIKGDAVYLNCGTWADLMTVPRDLLEPEPDLASDEARARLSAFADDLAYNRIDGWRRLIPTFVRVDLDRDGQVREAALEMWSDGGEPVRVTTEILKDRLGGRR